MQPSPRTVNRSVIYGFCFIFLFYLFILILTFLASSVSSRAASAASTAKPSRPKRVVAKKTTVRAPMASSKKPVASEAEEEEMEGISLSSTDSINEEELPTVASKLKSKAKKTADKTTDKTAKTNKKTAKKSSSKSSEKPADKSSKKSGKKSKEQAAPVEEDSDSEPEKPARNKGGRPKSKKPAKPADEQPASPTKKNLGGRPTRVVNHFVGGQKHALVAKRIFTDPLVAVDQRPQAIVIERALFEPEKPRRERVPWTLEEADNLEAGVRKHGEGRWSDILADPELYFNESRTQVDLKDKWRNMTAYVEYSLHPMRKFVLVDSTHQMIRSPAGNLHVFNNRWPRDAALKAATKDKFYPLDENDERSVTTLIHLKELLDQDGKKERPEIVHVYRVTRILQRPKNLSKFEGYAAVWTGKVEKVAEEIMIRQEEVLTPEDEKLIEMQRKREQLQKEKGTEAQS